MKKLSAILTVCLLLVTACAATNQNSKSLSSSYDGIWEGYTKVPEGHFVIKMEIKNGVMSGYFDDTKIKGYIEAEKNLFIRPFSFMETQVILETKSMSPDRIEGNVIAISYRHPWFVIKKK